MPVIGAYAGRPGVFHFNNSPNFVLLPIPVGSTFLAFTWHFPCAPHAPHSVGADLPYRTWCDAEQLSVLGPIWRVSHIGGAALGQFLAWVAHDASVLVEIAQLSRADDSSPDGVRHRVQGGACGCEFSSNVARMASYPVIPHYFE